VVAELLIGRAALVVAFDGGRHLEGPAELLNGSAGVAVFEIDLAALIVGAGGVGVEIERFVEIGQRCFFLALVMFGYGAVEVRLTVVRPDLNGAVEVGHGLFVRTGAQLLHTSGEFGARAVGGVRHIGIGQPSGGRQDSHGQGSVKQSPLSALLRQ